MESQKADGQPIDVKRTGKVKTSISWKKQSHMQRPYYQSSPDAILLRTKRFEPRDDRGTDNELLLCRLQDWRHQELKLTSTERNSRDTQLTRALPKRRPQKIMVFVPFCKSFAAPPKGEVNSSSANSKEGQFQAYIPFVDRQLKNNCSPTRERERGKC